MHESPRGSRSSSGIQPRSSTAKDIIAKSKIAYRFSKYRLLRDFPCALQDAHRHSIHNEKLRRTCLCRCSQSSGRSRDVNKPPEPFSSSHPSVYKTPTMELSPPTRLALLCLNTVHQALSLGISCRGSSQCALDVYEGDTDNLIKDFCSVLTSGLLSDALAGGPIDPASIYRSGQHIVCA